MWFFSKRVFVSQQQMSLWGPTVKAWAGEGDYGEILRLCSVALEWQVCSKMLKALPFCRTFTVICSVKDRQGRGESDVLKDNAAHAGGQKLSSLSDATRKKGNIRHKTWKQSIHEEFMPIENLSGCSYKTGHGCQKNCSSLLSRVSYSAAWYGSW